MRMPKKFKRWYREYGVLDDLVGFSLSTLLCDRVRRIAYRSWRNGRKVERENIARQRQDDMRRQPAKCKNCGTEFVEVSLMKYFTTEY
jgi:hypothetical protein